MGKAGIRASIPALLEMFRDPQSPMRYQAGQALGDLGPLAGEAIPELIEMLRDGDVIQFGPTAVFRYTVTDESQEALLQQLYDASVTDALRSVPGIGYATSNYFLMLLGAPGVKPDRMVHRFLRGALGRGLTNARSLEYRTACNTPPLACWKTPL